ncbi:dephospho-CoA kinase [Rheinheimera texasensis]|uniref:dephospho-CoA kinase n=1 Tax=Rheinheimera texasensis TaxID=306205 RepID=UPI0004E27468|nr:dephospho-CoA kinase [Rheinheimera texasensis]
MHATQTARHFRVGLTGGIGSGKSTVATAFSELGIAIVDADIVARAVVAPGSDALAQISGHFGEHVLSADGQLDRARLREIVFADSTAKNWLNQLLHPRIRQQMLAQLDSAASPYSILVAPLLLENQLNLLVDVVLVVDVSPETQLSRTMQRDNNSAGLVQSIMAAQCSRAERLAAADYVIDNEAPPAMLAGEVAKLHRVFLQLAEEKLAKSLT